MEGEVVVWKVWRRFNATLQRGSEQECAGSLGVKEDAGHVVVGGCAGLPCGGRRVES